MQKIQVSLAEEGMVLARDVRTAENPSGPNICGKGTELTSSMIKKLREMGINTITVEGHPIWSEGDKNVEEQLSELDFRFSRTVSLPLMNILHKIYRAQTKKSMGMSDGE